MEPTTAVAQPTEPSIERPDEATTEIKPEVTENGIKEEETKEENKEEPAAADMIEEKKEDSAAAAAPAADTNMPEESAQAPAAPKEEEDANTVDNATTASADAASPDGNADTPAKSNGNKSRRKSGVPEHRGKNLKRKASQAKLLNLDAKPGMYYYVKLKGYPTWPAVICDEDMLPQALLSTRPQTAARMDGTYREEYADGGKRVKERTYPVMFMATNEFAWTPNTDLRPLNVEESKHFPANRVKSLNLAHELAAEQHPLSHWKEVLREFAESQHQAALEEQQRAAAKEEKEKKKAAKKAPKAGEAEDEDTTMDLGMDSEPKKKKTTQKKRELAEGEAKTETPATKKLKLTISSKATNGTPASSSKPKSEKKQSAAKPKKTAAEKKAAEAKPAEPELTPEELRLKKEREILFLRHKLQKGLLNRDNPPEEDQMAQMAEYLNKLEGYPDLEVSIIKTTKINKVLKAILKLEVIPKEAEYNFKPRSTTLLQKWNTILENAPREAASSSAAPAATNGLTNGDAKAEKAEPSEKQEEVSVKEEVPQDTNGTKSDSEAAKSEKGSEEKMEEKMEEKKEEVADVDTVMQDADKGETEVAAAAPAAEEETKDTVLPDAPAVEAST